MVLLTKNNNFATTACKNWPTYFYIYFHSYTELDRQNENLRKEPSSLERRVKGGWPLGCSKKSSRCSTMMEEITARSLRSDSTHQRLGQRCVAGHGHSRDPRPGNLHDVKVAEVKRSPGAAGQAKPGSRRQPQQSDGATAAASAEARVRTSAARTATWESTPWGRRTRAGGKIFQAAPVGLTTTSTKPP